MLGLKLPSKPFLVSEFLLHLELVLLCLSLLNSGSKMKSVSHTVAVAVLAALPLTDAITPEGMLAAPRRGAAVANPSGV